MGPDGAGPVGCVDSGSGWPAVVFVGGARGLALAWEPVREQVAAVTRAVAVDRPGYGLSRPRPGPAVVSPPRLAAELFDAIDGAAVRTCVVLVAHSFGGFARAFAAAHPQVLAGLVVVDSVHEDEWSVRYPEAHRRGMELAARSLALLAGPAWSGVPRLLERLPVVPLAPSTGCRGSTGAGRACSAPGAAASAPSPRSSPAWRRRLARWPHRLAP